MVTVVDSGGKQYVSPGGTAEYTIISGGTLELGSGALLGGYPVVFAGPGGTLRIDGTAMPSDTISGLVGGDTFDLAGIPYVSSGSVNLLSGNVLQIVESGQTYDLNLDSAQYFLSEYFTVSSGATGETEVSLVQVPLTTSAEVNAGLVAEGITVGHGGSLIVLSGGTATATVIDSGGTLLVSSGGFAYATTLLSGGSEIVSSGGIDLIAQISGSKQDVFGLVIEATVLNGSQVVELGATASGTILSGGSEIVSAGAIDDEAQISGGTQFDYGTVSDATIFTGSQVVEATTSASGTILSGGAQLVYGLASSAVVIGGSEYVELGGRAIGATLEGGTYVSGAFLSALAFVYGAASNTSVGGTDAYEYVEFRRYGYERHDRRRRNRNRQRRWRRPRCLCPG